MTMAPTANHRRSRAIGIGILDKTYLISGLFRWSAGVMGEVEFSETMPQSVAKRPHSSMLLRIWLACAGVKPRQARFSLLIQSKALNIRIALKNSIVFC